MESLHCAGTLIVIVIVIEVLWWLGMEPLHRAGTLIVSFFVYFILSTKRPPMLWGSTCRAVTSFRPYELVDRLSNASICYLNAYAYLPIELINRPVVRLWTLVPYCYL